MKTTYQFRAISAGRKPTFAVGLATDTGVTDLGTVEHIHISHLKRKGWRATTPDGRHMAFHDERWQAAWALGWAARGMKGYPPFPVAKSHQKEVEAV